MFFAFFVCLYLFCFVFLYFYFTSHQKAHAGIVSKELMVNLSSNNLVDYNLHRNITLA